MTDPLGSIATHHAMFPPKLLELDFPSKESTRAEPELSLSRAKPMKIRNLLPLVATLISLPAMSSSYGVFNGAAMTWIGSTTNTNQISLSAGEVFINGNAYEVSHTNIVLKTGGSKTQTTNFSFDSNGDNVCTATGESFYVYYMYYQPPTGAAEEDVVISSKYEPWPDGYPSHSLTWATTKTSQTGVFLGSYLCDSSDNVVPFRRSGDEVILTPAANLTGFDGASPLVYADKVVAAKTADFTSTAGSVLTLSFSTSTPTPLVPKSASAMIIDLTAIDASATNCTGSKNMLSILAPKLHSATSQYSQVTLPVNCTPSTFGGQATFARLRVQHNQTATSDDLYLYAANTGPYAVVAMRGYVEHIQQLSNSNN